METYLVAWNPRSSDDYRAVQVSDETTYHWDDSCSWGEGFSTKEEAIEYWWNYHSDDDSTDDDVPEILEIGSEMDGLREQIASGLCVLDPEEFVELCIEEAAEELENPVFFEHCPRGFANELGFVAVDESRADDFRDDDKYEELDKEQLVARMCSGAESHARDSANNINTYCNPSCGSYGIEIIR